MKEFYLLPKHQFEVLNSKKVANGDVDKNPKEFSTEKTKGETSRKPRNTRNVQSKFPKVKPSKMNKTPQPGQRWRTRMLPPPLKKSINMKGMIYHNNNNENKKNPNIQHHLAMKLYGKDLSHAKLLLNHLEKTGDVEWNEYGDILHPLRGYNIVNFMVDVVTSDKLNLSKLEDYKFIFNTANIPIDYIKNKRLLKHINQNPPSTIVGKKSKIFTQSQVKPSWTTF